MAKGKERSAAPGPEDGAGPDDGRRAGTDTSTTKNKPLVVVGVGASAGGLQAFSALLDNLPPQPSMAFVLVQHLSPEARSLLSELLAPHSSMPLHEAVDGMAVEGGHVYVIPPDCTLSLQDGHLQVTRPAPPRSTRWPIDTFFSTLAQDQGNCAVAVVLAGNGSDGARGLQVIKDYGGLSIAQVGFDHAALVGMPASAAATGLVDDVLAVEDIPARLIAHCDYLRGNHSRITQDKLRDDLNPHLSTIFSLLRRDIGHDFAHYKEQTMVRRVQRRMQVLQIPAAGDYVQRLRSDPVELQRLFSELLISVTEFFRDPAAFTALQLHVIPQLLANCGKEAGIRVWVAGCATGEEAYTIAMLLGEGLAGAECNVQIFATDIDERAIASARAGRYRAPLAGVDKQRLARWFTKDGDDYIVTKAIREMCIFSLHSAIKDPPFSRLDLVSCRNLMIYFDADLQQRLLRVFHYALLPGGHLLLGSAEGPSRTAALFEVVDKKQRLYRKKGDSVPMREQVRSASITTASIQAAYPVQRLQPLPPAIGDAVNLAARRAMEKHSPAYVVVDTQHDIMRFGGNTGRYLEPSSGATTLNLFSLLQQNLRGPARLLLQQARSEGHGLAQDGLWIDVDHQRHPVRLIVEPLTVGPNQNLCLLAFSEFMPLAETSVRELPHQPLEVELAQREQSLAQELETTRHQLHSAIDQLETMTEELRSVSEEYQSVNEELQSTNEELETSKEELQSINQELQTVNAEMQSKNELLARVNSDLHNLMESTQIATLFLDTDLRITGFTPAATDVFNLRSMDRGRPITDISTRIAYPQLEQDVAKVLRTLEVTERTLGDGTTSYLLRMRPYRTVENKIDGVVLTFIDITDRQRNEMERARLAAIVDSSSDAIFSRRPDGTVMSWNRAAERVFGQPASLAIGHPVEQVLPDSARLALGTADSIAEAEFSMDRDGSLVEISMISSPIRDPAGTLVGVATIARDITERRQQDLARSETRFASLINQASVGVAQLDLHGRIVLVNPCFCLITARDAAALKALSFQELDEAPPQIESILKNLLDHDHSEVFEHTLLKPDGSEVCVRSAVSVVRSADGAPRNLIVILSDITEQREIQRHLAMMLDELNHRVKNTLATVQAVALQTLSRSPEPEQFRQAFLSRLAALSQTHNLLAKDVWSGVWLRQLIHNQLAPYGETRFKLVGVDLKLNPKVALALSMAFHELTTNAAKYGALLVPKGRVSVCWSTSEADRSRRLQLRWTEHGGPRISEPECPGFGTRLITRGLAHELDADVELTFPVRGVVCTIDLPIDVERRQIDLPTDLERRQ